jgi:hypothetical protein
VPAGALYPTLGQWKKDGNTMSVVSLAFKFGRESMDEEIKAMDSQWPLVRSPVMVISCSCISGVFVS